MSQTTQTAFLDKLAKGQYGSHVSKKKYTSKNSASEHREIFMARCHETIQKIRSGQRDEGKWRWVEYDGVSWLVTLRAGNIPIACNGSTTRQFLDVDEAITFLADAAEAARLGELDALIASTRKQTGRRKSTASV